MQDIEITRTVTIPDPLKIERYRTAPQNGPRILFFSGGTALQGVSRDIIKYTHNSVHLITPFDSGGSSAVLRKEFSMPAVGDIRNRLMSLADDSALGNPEIYAFFTHRLDKKSFAKRLTPRTSALVRRQSSTHQGCAVPNASVYSNQHELHRKPYFRFV
jgi:2-phospho-L-lactate transferase CofD-like protein